MFIDINFSDYSGEFIGCIAEKTESPDTLDAIVDFAIGEANYSDDMQFETEEGCYMDKVCENPHLSRKSIIKLINYKKSKFIHWGIIDRDDLDEKLIDMLSRNLNDATLMIELFEYHTVSRSTADYIATRIMTESSIYNNCIIKEPCPCIMDEIIDNGIDTISNFCTDSKRAELLEWWKENQKQIFSTIRQEKCNEN